MKRQRIRQIQKNPKVKTGSGIYSKTMKKALTKTKTNSGNVPGRTTDERTETKSRQRQKTCVL